MELEPSEIKLGLDVLNHLNQKRRPELITLPVIGYECYLKDPGDGLTDDPPPKLLTRDTDVITIDEFLGTYDPDKQRITLFESNIKKAADILGCREDDLQYIVRYHEHAHAALHLGVDEKERIKGIQGGRFTASRLRQLTKVYTNIEPFLHEHLAQLITYQVLKNLSQSGEDELVCRAASRMLDVFNKLMQRQPSAYRVERYLNVPLERLNVTIRLIKEQSLVGQFESWKKIMNLK